MYRDLGLGQPRFSSESRLESVMETLKILVGGPTQTNSGIATRLNPDKYFLHLTCKILGYEMKFRVDHTQLG